MKAYHFLAALLLVMSLRLSYSQNEIEKYKQPDLIEGSNLILSTFPYYSFDTYNDTISYNRLRLDAGADFTKWRFTPKLDYSFHTRLKYSYTRGSVTNAPFDGISNSTYGNLTLDGSMNYYPLKIPVYGGIFLSSISRYATSNKPASNNDLYTYLGFGRAVNAGQVINTKNLENVLQDEGIITKKLPGNVFRELTVLLDKRYNSEFSSKFKEDADIEFFSQVEKLLIDENVINKPLNSRTVLKLYQALTNGNFVNYPRYKGFLAQAEINYNNINYRYTSGNLNVLTMVISGLYGIPIGLKTNLVFTYYAALPLNDHSREPGYTDIFRSPITLREKGFFYPLIDNDLDKSIEYDYYTGGKVLAFYNLSSTAGVSGFVNVNYGKTKDIKSKYTVYSAVNFRYNILSQLYLNAYINFSRGYSTSKRFSSGLDLNYILF